MFCLNQSSLQARLTDLSGAGIAFVGAYRVPSTVDHDWKSMLILQNQKEHDLKMLFSSAPYFQTFR